MNSDAAFYMGKTHNVCQDYALSSQYNNNQYIVLSDGCSGSPNTDIGSRVICECLKKQLNLTNFYPKFKFDINNNILFHDISNGIQSLDISRNSLDATLLLSAIKNNKIYAQIIGDGIIILKDKNKYIHIVSSEYTHNYPFYLNYLNCPNIQAEDRYIKWQQIENNNKIVTILSISPEKEIIYQKDIEISSLSSKEQILINDNITLTSDIRTDDIITDIDNYEWISLSSDGLHSFYEIIETETSKTNKEIPFQNIILELLSFKNFNGNFVQRRLKRFLKDCDKKNWGYRDDISLATIYFGE